MRSPSRTRSRTSVSRSTFVAFLGLVSMLAATACGGPPAPIDVDFKENANEARVAKWIAGEGDRELEWVSCEVSGPLEESAADQPRATSECAQMTVPVDWFRPGDATTEVALHRVNSTGDARGDLLLNPGGPGDSGTAMAAWMSLEPSAQPLLEHFNFIGFDPRGVGSSFGVGDPFVCAVDAAPDCEPSTDLEYHASTAAVAHDMEYLRILLGDEPLNFLGYSYGTYLGAIYARLFPSAVGAMVLDGPAPARSFTESGYEEQVEAFAESRERFLQACVDGAIGSCPFTGTAADAEDQIAQWIAEQNDKPVDFGDGVTFDGESIAAYLDGIVYESRDTWPEASQVLNEAMREDDEAMITIAEAASVAVDDPIVQAVLCAIEDVQKEPGCGPQPVYDPPVSYSGESTIVVIALTGDPATPFTDAAPLVEQLGNAVLVTVEGEGHAASYGKSACASRIATEYFVSGTVPAADTRC